MNEKEREKNNIHNQRKKDKSINRRKANERKR